MMASERGAYAVARRLAGGFWLGAALVYLAAEDLSASAFRPPYSYATNYISDLGVAACGLIYAGRPICSPRHVLMNAGFVIQGLLFVAAAISAARCVRGRARHALVAFAAINCLGISLVGIFPEAEATGAATLPYHVLGAFLAIVAGNAAVATSSALSGALGLPRFHRFASLALACLGIIGLAMLIVAQARGPWLVPDGVWERVSVYTITTWEIFTAACLLMTDTQAELIPRHRSS